jgi:hypothetical protein
VHADRAIIGGSVPCHICFAPDRDRKADIPALLVSASGGREVRLIRLARRILFAQSGYACVSSMAAAMFPSMQIELTLSMPWRKSA